MSTRKRERRKSLTPEEKFQRAVSARRKFRAVVKLIIANLAWLQEMEDDKLGDNVKKNIAVLTRKKGKKSLLTLRDKTVLNTPPELRTDEEKQHLKRIIGNLKCFRRFPADVKAELPIIMFFSYFGPNRVIIKQDYEPLNMYVILTGEVVVSQTWFDKLLKEEVTKDVLIMSAGNYFGEVALLHGINRTATVTTLTPCEFLYIKRDDFERVLKEPIANLWEEIRLNMSWFSYFAHWNEVEIREACIYAKKKHFSPEEIILGASMGSDDSVYFVTKGFCYLTEHMQINTRTVKGITKYRLIRTKFDKGEERLNTQLYKDIKKMFQTGDEPEDNLGAMRPNIRPSTDLTLRKTIKKSQAPEPPEGQTRTHFIKICIFNKLACFNVGETMRNRIVVAAVDTECLLLPRYFLHEKGMSTFKHVGLFLNNHIPNTEQVFNNFVEEKKWCRYRENLVRDILADRKHKMYNFNTIHNVPYTVRLAEDLGEI